MRKLSRFEYETKQRASYILSYFSRAIGFSIFELSEDERKYIDKLYDDDNITFTELADIYYINGQVFGIMTREDYPENRGLHKMKFHFASNLSIGIVKTMITQILEYRLDKQNYNFKKLS